MSSHQVIARKWRPQKFGDVVGQTHVIRTLRNAIACDRVGHAYLLVGPRGIGKTTIARIFAKAINCENPQDGEPCCQCNSCLALAGDSSLDVIEIDAASRNSVEHMRALSEEAYHMPVASKYKIYIIDEVHMLSKAAWIHQISDGIWMASYLAIMPYWIVVIASSRKQQKGWTPGKGFRIFFGIYAAFTLLVYILQLARNF